MKCQLGLRGLLSKGFCNMAGAQAAGAYTYGNHFARWKLMAYFLEIGVEAAVCFDVGVADQVAGLGFFSTKMTFFTHNKKPPEMIKNCFGRLPSLAWATTN